MGAGRTILAAVLGVAACDRLPPQREAPAPSAALATAAPASPAYLTQQPVLALAPARPEKPRTAGIHTPPPGSADRVALMNALRGAVRNEIGGDVVFVVRELRSDGEWAFAVLEPTRPDGRRIAPETTPLYRRHGGDGLDGLRTEAIWRKERDHWQVFAHAVGATDVWWTAYCERTPRDLMPGC